MLSTNWPALRTERPRPCTALFTVAFLALGSVANAGDYDANCQFSSEWIKHQSDYSPAVFTDLTQCQMNAMGLDTDNVITLGGEGGASTIGIDLGGDGDGCDSGTDCMKMCQALCCITKGCTIAMMHKKTEKHCEVSCDIYKEEVDYYKCYMYGSGSTRRSGSSVTSSCYTDPKAPNYDNCLAIAADSDFHWDKATFDYLKAQQNCGTATVGKKLLAKGTKKVKVPLMGSKLVEKLEKGMKPATRFGARLQKAVKKAGGADAFKKQLMKRIKK